jgi:phosphatidylserine synthase
MRICRSQTRRRAFGKRYICVCMCTCVNVCVYVYVCVCVWYVYVYVYVCVCYTLAEFADLVDGVVAR